MLRCKYCNQSLDRIQYRTRARILIAPGYFFDRKAESIDKNTTTIMAIKANMPVKFIILPGNHSDSQSPATSLPFAPLAGRVAGFHRQVGAPCRAHPEEKSHPQVAFFTFQAAISYGKPIRRGW
jgi:hypothetical protein